MPWAPSLAPDRKGPGKATACGTTLALLTWRSPATLENTLRSLAPISHWFAERIIVCQEGDPAEVALARQFGFRPCTLSTNVGIQNGLKAAVELSANESVVLLENDCVLDATPEDALDRLEAIRRELYSGTIAFARLAQMGAPRRRVKKYWALGEAGPRLTPYGLLRYGAATAVAAEAALTDWPRYRRANCIARAEAGFAVTDSRYIPWTNRAAFVSKSFFLGTIIPFAETHPTSRHANGHPELEHRLNSLWRRHWWRSQRFPLAVAAPGLFGHSRFDRAPSDDKWGSGGEVTVERDRVA